MLLSRVFLIVFLLFSLSACTSQYMAAGYQKTKEVLSLEEQHELIRKADWRLATHTPLYLAKPSYPQQTSSGSTEYLRARYALLSALERAFIARYPTLHTETSALELDEAITASQIAGARVLVYPQLLGYLDYADKSGGNAKAMFSKDKTTIQILLIDVYSQKILDTATIQSKSKIFNSSNNYASDLFEQAAWEYVQQLSGATAL
ncbi:protein of unknown function [Alteromonadaceae bacterium Bs31]|nr:protein of unknown function [Alteromonadaceae bacterium Bs31]